MLLAHWPFSNILRPHSVDRVCRGERHGLASQLQQTTARRNDVPCGHPSFLMDVLAKMKPCHRQRLPCGEPRSRLFISGYPIKQRPLRKVFSLIIFLIKIPASPPLRPCPRPAASCSMQQHASPQAAAASLASRYPLHRCVHTLLLAAASRDQPPGPCPTSHSVVPVATVTSSRRLMLPRSAVRSQTAPCQPTRTSSLSRGGAVQL